MADDFERSIGDEATLAGKAKRRPLSELVSLGDERTLGDGRSEQETLIDDIEVVDLEARYRVEGTLGKGGMGAVLLATDTRLDRKVAIKRILGEAAGNRMAVQRFLTEAKAIAAINHPNIVQIYDYGRAEDGPFLIMEYVDGGSLLDRCRDGALPLDQAVALACQLCDGLAKAHDLGIVHRDIKPANVLLTKDGSPKLTDFGLAKADAADHQMTITGAVLGTPDFMPPEQRRDAALVDHRSDLWSLAATFYQMVTGRSPKIIRFNDIPVALQEVLAKALEDAKEARYQSAREFRDSLRGTLAAADPGSTDLDAGQCPACGVKNDSSRRFCRGCGGSLEAPCLSCERPMPMWEEICGQCGSKQTPLLSERRSEMAAQQAEAESLLKDYDFEHSERITIALRDEVDPRLKQCVPWAKGFLDELGAAQELQKKKANEWLTEALKHEASYDYKAAAKVLEQVPLRLREQTLLGRSESLAITLNRLTAKRDEARRLQTTIKKQIKSNELSGLLEEVERLRLLRPDRRDLQVLAAQLTDRHSKLTALRDEAIDRAKALLIAKDWEKALAALKEVDPSVESPETERLRTDARTSLERLQAFLQEIRQAVANKQLDGLLSRVDAALELKPGHQDLVRLRENLLTRERKIAAEIDALIAEGDNAFKACAFNKAKAALLRIPEWRRDEVTARLKTADHLGALRSAAMESMEWFSQAQDLTSAEPDLLMNAVRDCRTYLFAIADHQLKDPSVEEWHDKLEAATAKHQSSRRRSRWLRESFRQILAGTTAIGRDFREYIADLTDHFGVPQKIRQFAVTVFAMILFGAAAWGVYYGCVGAWRTQNSIGMRLTYIPSGEYGRKIVRLVFDERNREKFIRSKVRMPSPFYIGCTEVTQGQWKAIVNTRPWHGQPNAIDRDTQPATYMSRASAEEFCKALTERERAAGRISQSQRYRLPTEVEWEYACASDSSSTFYAGDSPETVSPYEWCAANSDGADGDHPRDVALKWPTKRGIYDAFGNVSEICTDFVRGACWTDPPDRCAISRNTNASPSDGNAQTGFRVLLESTR